MGLDMAYQAIPGECDLIGSAWQDEELAEMLCGVPYWFRNEAGPTSWPKAEKLWREISELSARHPGLESRNCFLDRCWDKLHYLLSANRRNDSGGEEDDVFDKAVRGERETIEQFRARGGSPVKYVSPDTVQMIALLLEPISAGRLRAHYDPVAMEASAVYKFWADRADEAEWNSISGYFVSFRSFYLEAARHREGVLVCLD
jgi:hypothetical protein